MTDERGALKAEIRRRREQILATAPFMTQADHALERELHATKWFDYRFMSPMDATQRFAEDYAEIFRQKWEQFFDIRGAPKKVGIKKGSLLGGGREFTSLLRARQHADRLGLPYPFAIRTAMDRHFDDGYTKPPRPNQLFTGPRSGAVHVALTAQWMERNEARMFWPGLKADEEVDLHAPYRAENYRALPAQIAHRDWVARHPRVAANVRTLGRVIAVDRLLDVETAERVHGVETTARALELTAGVEPLEHRPVGPDQVLPSCFGVPGTCQPSQDPCCGCPVTTMCGKIGDSTLAAISARYGTDDPLEQKRKEDTRRRVAKHRAAKKLRQGGWEPGS